MSEIKRFGAESTDNIKRPKTVALGIGGAGRNIISSVDSDSMYNISMYEVGVSEKLPELSFIQVSKKDLQESYESGVGPQGRPLNDSEKKIDRRIDDADLIYILCGLGGETGSWGSVMCSQLSEKLNAFTLSLFAMPFDSESPSRQEFADEAQERLQESADVAAEFGNSRLLDINPHISINKAFEVMNTIIRLPMKDFNGVMTRSDISNLKDFCCEADSFRIGAGYGKGMKRGKKASEEAFRSPWLEDLEDYDIVLTVVTSGKGTAEMEAQDALEVIQDRCPHAEMMWGLRKDKDIGERTRVTLLAGK